MTEPGCFRRPTPWQTTASATDFSIVAYRRHAGRSPALPRSTAIRATAATNAPSKASGHQTAAGFTLLEVLIAFFIAALALGVMARASVGSLHAIQATARYEEALTLARSRLAMASSAAPLVATDQHGEAGDSYRWRVLVAPVATTPLRPLGSRGPWQNLRVQTVLYTVSVWVWWHDEGSEAASRREVRLDTQRVASAVQ